MKLSILTSLLFVSSLYAQSYKGCANTKQEALYTLSGNIKSEIHTHIEETIIEDQDSDVQSKINSYVSATTNLSLVNINYTQNEEKLWCAVVEKSDQVTNTQKLLKKALLFKETNLPDDIDSKIEQLSQWIHELKQLSFLVPLFLENFQEDLQTLNAKEKKFTDLYNSLIEKSNSLFFKSCQESKEEAKQALNKKLFPREKSEEKGFLDSLTSIFTQEQSNTIELFNEYIVYTKKDKKSCAMIKKMDLENIVRPMYNEIARFKLSDLPKKPKEKYKETQKLLEQIKLTNALMKLFPNLYTQKSFDLLYKQRKKITRIQEETHPQYVLFNVKGAKSITIELDGKTIKNNEKVFLKNGDHSYNITANGMCPMSGTLSNDLLEDITLSKSFAHREYPTVIFVTDVNPTIVVDGKAVSPNVRTTIKKCTGSAHYLVKYTQQTKKGTIKTKPGLAHQIDIDFLDTKEVHIFNDAKTKKFTLENDATFSETLTPLVSEKLHFTLYKDAKHGEVVVHESGSFQYTPQKGYVGRDSFEYTIESPQKTTPPKIVVLEVKPSSFIAPVIKEVKKLTDVNSTLSKAVETKREEVKEAVEKVNSKELEKVDEDFERKYKIFKEYVESKDLSMDILKEIQKKYPKMFQRLLKEKTAQ